jgi:energy-coupling factor transporter ATP-binding protein EcfA2
MNTLKVDFKYCYGIRNLQYEFDYGTKNVIALYAGNGTMKTSFTNTMRDISQGKTPEDRIHPNNNSNNVHNVTYDNDIPIEPQSILAIESFDEKFEFKNHSNLLVNKDLYHRYSLIRQDIDNCEEILLLALRDNSGYGNQKTVKDALLNTFNKQELSSLLLSLQNEVELETDDSILKFEHKKLFGKAEKAFLTSSEVRPLIKKYITSFDQITKQSVYYKEGFNHSSAEDVTKNLTVNKFFAAGHKVCLAKDNENELLGKDEFDNKIKEEYEKVVNSEELKHAFSEIHSKMTNQALHGLKNYLIINQDVMLHLNNIEEFEKKLWIVYLSKNRSEYDEYIKKLHDSRAEIKSIEQEAVNQLSKWIIVLKLFKERFYVPFDMHIENIAQAITGSKGPEIKYTYKDYAGLESIDEDTLKKVLSRGERRARYLLDIMFEIELRKLNEENTLLVIDDIADSFDYQNKYAIIEYLRDVADLKKFRMLLLSHNFDFHRTVCSRLGLKEDSNQVLTASSLDSIITIDKQKFLEVPFVKWLGRLDEESVLIASIPFCRNIAQYTKDSHTYNLLTEFLHIKERTSMFKLNDYITILNSIIFNGNRQIPSGERLYLDVIYNNADMVSKETLIDIDLEKKIALAMAIRLKAEQFMIEKIGKTAEQLNITRFQTYNLYKKCRDENVLSNEQLKVLRRVNLMTPENIHINSFMFEPILDMSIHNLRNHYKEVCSL